jgi:hypothetical protein
MTDQGQPGVLGSLPRTRPHRRSDKRRDAPVPVVAPEPAVSAAKAKRAAASPKRAAAKPRTAAAKAKRAAAKPRAAAAKPKRAAAAQPAATPDAPRTPRREPPPPAATPGMLQTAVQAAAELAEIGLQASARTLRRTLSRLPRP